jgi:hypothetical protein
MRRRSMTEIVLRKHTGVVPSFAILSPSTNIMDASSGERSKMAGLWALHGTWFLSSVRTSTKNDMNASNSGIEMVS